MQVKNYLPPLRRIAEAVAARLNYDFLCFKGPLMDEGYLIQGVSDVLCSFYDPNMIVIRKNSIHPVLLGHAKASGRKPEIDYVAVHRSSTNYELAIEAKWAGSTHCTPVNILWDLVRLKMLKEEYPQVTCGLLIAGNRKKMDKLFQSDMLREGTERPLNPTNNRRKNFRMADNKEHQSVIDVQIADWKSNYPSIVVPAVVATQLQESSFSANQSFRFVARCWEIM